MTKPPQHKAQAETTLPCYYYTAAASPPEKAWDTNLTALPRELCLTSMT